MRTQYAKLSIGIRKFRWTLTEGNRTFRLKDIKEMLRDYRERNMSPYLVEYGYIAAERDRNGYTCDYPVFFMQNGIEIGCHFYPDEIVQKAIKAYL